MLRNLDKNITFLIIASALLSACGEDPQSGDKNLYKNKPTSATGEMTEQDAKAFDLTTAANSAKPTDDPNEVVYVASGTSVSDQKGTPCYTSSGNTTNSDQDKVPVDATYSYQCSYLGGMGKVEGQFNIRDENDSLAFPLAGYNASFQDFKLTIGVKDSSVTSVSNGIKSLTVEPNQILASSAMSTFVSASTSSQTMSVGSWFDAVVKPNQMKDPGAGGTFEISGFVQMESASKNFILKLGGQGLAYGGCSSGFIKSGTITLVDGNGNKLEAIWTDCQKYTRKYNGKNI